MLKARRLWLLAHRWVGLSLGLLLLLAGLTGAALTVTRPLDEALHPELFQAPAAPPGAVFRLDAVRERLSAEFGSRTGFTFRPPREPGETLHVYVRGPWSGTLHLDPASGTELGRRGEHEGLFNVLFELHATLLMEETGRALLALAVLSYVLLLVTGAVLWWPSKWRHAFSIKLVAGLTRSLFDLHRVGGAVLGLGVLVSVLTGAYMAWRPISVWVTGVAGAVPLKPPPVRPPLPAAKATTASLERVVEQARTIFPAGQLGYVQWPAGAGAAGRIRFRLPDDPHPNGLSSVWFDPNDGRILAAHRWSELDPGARGYAWIYPLHIGRLGGTGQLVLNFVFGAVLAGFGVSGVWLWWRRRRARRASGDPER
ncbi:PepSY domain-containing protein [Aquabacterium sp. A7-Y]|nr:PepSY domain-containing protein [Aquabacterium sp. A7-Y]